MASPRSEFSTARVVSIATVVLAIGLLLLTALVLFNDYRDRRDERAAFKNGSESALNETLTDAEMAIERALLVADEAGQDLALRIAEIDAPGDVALAAAVDAAEVDKTVPALERVIYQDAVAQVFGVDRFASRTKPSYQVWQ